MPGAEQRVGDAAIMTEAITGEHDDGRNPADARDIAEDRGSTRIESGQWIASGGCGVRSGVVYRLFGAALGAIEGPAHLVSTLAAKRHLLLHTLFLLRVFRQPEFIFVGKSGIADFRGRLPQASAAGHNLRMRTLIAFLLLVASAAILPAAKNLQVYSIDVEGGQATLIVSPFCVRADSTGR